MTNLRGDHGDAAPDLPAEPGAEIILEESDGAEDGPARATGGAVRAALSAVGAAAFERKARRGYAWFAAPLCAMGLVLWGSSIPLDTTRGLPEGLAVAALYVGSAVLSITPGVAVLSVFARFARLGQATALGLLLAGSATFAMAGFWAWFASPAFGRGVDIGLLAASVVVIAFFGRRGDLRAFGLSGPLLLALAIGLAFTGLAFIQGNGIGANAPQVISVRYWRAADNLIPLQFAVKVAAHQPLSGILVGDWLSSDRPPLQTGFTLLQWPLWNSGPLRQAAAYQLLATGLSVSWLPALWVVFRVRGVANWRATTAVLATAFTGFVLVSTLYVWPKMLAGTLALGALAIVVSRDEADRKKGTGVLVIALLTLSMLAHGGTAFAIIALLPWAWRLRRRITLRAVGGCIGVLAVLYLPWALYQHFVDPPGDRLLKWQLAGQVVLTSDSFVKTLTHNYGQLTPIDLLANKWENILSLLVNPVMARYQGAEPAWAGGFYGYARIAQVNDLLPAAGLLLLGVLALLSPAGRRTLAAVKPLAAFTAIALLAWVLLLWGGEAVGTINHQGAYAVTVLFIGLCALAVTALPWPLMVLILAGSFAWFAKSWVPGLGFATAVQHHAPPGTAPWGQSVLDIRAAALINPTMLGVCVAGLTAMVAVLIWMYLSPRRRAEPSPAPASPAPSPTPA
jgi:hypothetical protein